MEKRVLENHNDNRFIQYEFGTLPGDDGSAEDAAGSAGPPSEEDDASIGEEGDASIGDEDDASTSEEVT